MNAVVQQKRAPVHRKVMIGGLVSGIVTVLCWAVGTFSGQQIPAEVAVALNGILTFIAQYLVPNQESGESQGDSSEV